jgi:hypothetical protein
MKKKSNASHPPLHPLLLTGRKKFKKRAEADSALNLPFIKNQWTGME